MKIVFFAGWRKSLTVITAFALAFQAFNPGIVRAVQEDFVPVTLCHQVGNGSYNQITVSTAGALNGHQGHEGDIIPMPEGGCPTGEVLSDSVVVTSSDIAITKTADGQNVESKNEGDSVVYTITAHNNGPDSATNVVVQDTLPAGVTYVSHNTAFGTYNPGTGDWAIGTIANGADATLDITVTVNSGTAGQSIVNSAGVTANSTTDSQQNNNASTATVNVNDKITPPIEVDEVPCVNGPTNATTVVNAAQGTLNNGDPITDATRTNPNKTLGTTDGQFYSLGKGGVVTISFNSYILDVPGNDIALHEITNGRDSYPEERADVSVSQDGTTWFAVGTASGLDAGTGVSGFDFAPTGLGWVRYVKVADATNFAIHDATADGYDLDAVDATYGSCAYVDPSKEGSYDSSTGTLTYTINWSVIGTGSLPVTITDVLPANTTYVPASADNGGVYDNPTRTLTWNLGTKNAGESGSVSFQVTLDAALAMDQWAKTVVSFGQGKQANLINSVDANRSDPTQALGVAQSSGTIYDNPLPDYIGKFVSLGFTQANTGGQIVVAFDHPVYNGPGNDIQLFEITGGDNYPDEHAQISVSDDNSTWTDVGVEVVRDGGVDLGAISQANFVRISDKSNKASFEDTADGFDVDAVKALQLVPNICQVENTANISWVISVSDSETTISVPASTQTVINRSFCQDTGFQISGQKWNDLNGNGVKDEGEPGLAGWVIYIDANDNGSLNQGEVSTTTDQNGNYTFTGLVPGLYIVREVNQGGWTQVYPGAENFYKHVVFVTDSNITGKNFGNHATDGGGGEEGGQGSITGVVFNDQNNNGVKDEGEPQLSGWVVFLDTNDNGSLDGGEPSKTTASPYLFTGLADGTYTVREILQNGWTQTFPTAGNGFKYTVNISGGSNAVDKDFGNFQTSSGGGGGGSSSTSFSSGGGGGTPPPPGQVKGDSTSTTNTGNALNTPAADPVPSILGATELPRTGSGPISLVLACILAIAATLSLRRFAEYHL